MENSLEKKQRVNLLMDLYEDLLTEKQREYLDLYYHEDLSLSEISLIKNVSKNAVFDNLKKACLHLENYEENQKSQIAEQLKNIKYIITLDADTDLVLNSAFELVGAMAHILNKPELDVNKNIVKKGA